MYVEIIQKAKINKLINKIKSPVKTSKNSSTYLSKLLLFFLSAILQTHLAIWKSIIAFLIECMNIKLPPLLRALGSQSPQ